MGVKRHTGFIFFFIKADGGFARSSFLVTAISQGGSAVFCLHKAALLIQCPGRLSSRPGLRALFG